MWSLAKLVEFFHFWQNNQSHMGADLCVCVCVCVWRMVGVAQVWRCLDAGMLLVCEPSGTGASRSGDWVRSLSYTVRKCWRLSGSSEWGHSVWTNVTCVRCWESSVHLPCTPCWRRVGTPGRGACCGGRGWVERHCRWWPSSPCAWPPTSPRPRPGTCPESAPSPWSLGASPWRWPRGAAGGGGGTHPSDSAQIDASSSSRVEVETVLAWWSVWTGEGAQTGEQKQDYWEDWNWCSVSNLLNN